MFTCIAPIDIFHSLVEKGERDCQSQRLIDLNYLILAYNHYQQQLRETINLRHAASRISGLQTSYIDIGIPIIWITNRLATVCSVTFSSQGLCAKNMVTGFTIAMIEKTVLRSCRKEMKKLFKNAWKMEIDVLQLHRVSPENYANKLCRKDDQAYFPSEQKKGGNFAVCILWTQEYFQKPTSSIDIHFLCKNSFSKEINGLLFAMNDWKYNFIFRNNSVNLSMVQLVNVLMYHIECCIWQILGREATKRVV